MSWFYVAIPVGSAIGFGLGGLAGWPLAFYLVVPPGILLGLACFFLREPQRGLSDLDNHHTVRHVSLKDYSRLFRVPSYVLNTAGMACLTFAMGGIAAWVPYYLETIRHLGTKAQVNLTFGGILVVSGLIGTIAGGLSGDALRKVTSGSYFLVSAIAMFLAFPTILCVIWAPPFFIWPAIFFTCFFLFFNTGPTNTILANVTNPHLRTAGFAVNILIIHALGDVVSPSLIGYLADAFATTTVDDLGKEIIHKNFEVGFITVSAVLLLGSMFWFIGMRFLARDSARSVHQLDD
jgi:predicted MFS family arabinose efflux permease